MKMLLCASLLLAVLPAGALAQNGGTSEPSPAKAAGAQSTAEATEGRWVWRSIRSKRKAQTEFSFWFERRDGVVRGTYSVDEFVDGVWQGEDGNQTPFRGEERDGTIFVEFDPAASVSGIEENVTYAPPTDGRKPSTATITFKGKKAEWKRTGGDAIEGVPDVVTLTRRAPVTP